MFRVNMLVFWVCMNIAYVAVILSAATADREIINGPGINFIEFMACYMAAMVVFKVFFAMIHIANMKM